MTADIIDFAQQSLKRMPMKSQRQVIRYAVLQSLAHMGPVEDSLIEAACAGLCAGLFGDAWTKAESVQRAMWLSVALEEYRKAIGSAA